MLKKMIFILFGISIILCTSNCSSHTLTDSDITGSNTAVYFGGLIYGKTGVIHEAVVVKNGIFIYTGSLGGALKTAGPNCKHINLQGRMMTPSFFDAHAHPNLSSLLELRDLPYAGSIPTPEEYVKHIKQYLQKNPNTQTLRGTGWDNAAFPLAPPNKTLLDQVTTDIPIIIRSSDQHSAWVNSKALEISNITKYLDSHKSQIELDEKKEPCGLVRDEVILLVDSALPPITVEEHKALILKFQNLAHSFGITGYMDAMVIPQSNQYKAYRELFAEKKLSMYTQLAFLMQPDTYETGLKWLVNEADTYEAEQANELLGFRIAKFFMDGAILGQTGYLLEDYATRPGYRGEPLWPADKLTLHNAFKLCDEKGIRIHIHSVGDAATKLALDGLEVVKTPNRHAITHLILVDPADITRFRSMNIIAAINPYWFCKSTVWADSELKQLGYKRSESLYPVKSFYDTGVTVAAASDYPVTSIPNPLIGIEMAVTRTLIESWRNGRTAEECTLNPAEAISAEQALDAFTLTAAYAYGLEEITGSIETGKSADFVLLDRNIFRTAPSEAKVLETWFRGKLVYKAK